MNRLLAIAMLIILLAPIFLSSIVYSYDRVPWSNVIANVEPPLKAYIRIKQFYPDSHFLIGDLNISSPTVEGYYPSFYITIYVFDNSGAVLRTIWIYKDIFGMVSMFTNNNERCFYGSGSGFLFLSADGSFTSRGYIVWIVDYDETRYLLRIELSPNKFVDTNCYLEKKIIYFDTQNNDGYFSIYNVKYEREFFYGIGGAEGMLLPQKVYILSGFTTRFLLRKSNYTDFSLFGKFYSSIQIRNITYLNYDNIVSYRIVGNTVYLGGPGIVIKVSEDSIVVPLILIRGNYLYVINRFIYDPNIGKYTFLWYEVFQIVESPHVVLSDDGGRYYISQLLLHLPKDEAPPPPIFYFDTLFASYDYVPGVGYVLTLKFMTDEGVFDFYVELNKLLFYGLRLANIIGINNLNLDDTIQHNLKVIDAIISTVSFYYFIKTLDPSVFISSQSKMLEINAPVENTGLVYRVTKGFNYLTCDELSERLNIDPKFLFCFNFNTNGYLPVEPITQTEMYAGLDVSQNLVKSYDIPAWYNLPGWFSLLTQVFSDTINIVVTVFKMLGQFLVLIFDRTIFTLIGLIIIFAHILIFLGNPSMVYGFYKDLIDMVVRFSHIIYDIIVKIATAVSTIIEAINPF